jgi:hypothetical protein
MEVSLNSEGSTPRKLTDLLADLGWKPVYGRYDYAYKWDPNWGSNGQDWNEFFDSTNKVHEVLKGHNVQYSLRTYENGKEDFFVKWSP